MGKELDKRVQGGSLLRIAVIIIALSGVVRTSAQSDFRLVQDISNLPDQAKMMEALKLKTSDKEPAAVRALAYFGLGILHFNLNQDSESQTALNESISLGTRLEDYARYHLGLSYKKTGQLDLAKKELNRVANFQPPSSRAVDARFVLGEMALDQKNYKEARSLFGSMERKTRRTSRYPEVLWNLIRAEHGSGNRTQACRWMKKIYTRYPGESVAVDWGVDLQSVKIDGKNSGCMVGPEDLKRRMRNLQHAGLNQKARSEIEVIRKRSSSETKIQTDMMLANFLINDGHVEEATTILAPHYESHSSNFSYLSLLAKSAARSGDLSLAANANLRAYRLSPGSRQGREALFQAAFLSYQSKDYDGATTKFNEFLKRYPSSGLGRDSRWYMAWIHYLKDDYTAAYKAFSDLKKIRSRRGRQILTSDRLDYWRAMSLLKAGQIEEARRIFKDVSSDSMYGYYSIAARARLDLVDQDLKNQKIEPRGPASENPLTNALALQTAPMVSGEDAPIIKTPKSEEDEGEEQLQSAEVAGEDEADATEVGDAEAQDSERETLRASFKDPRLEKQFLRAQDLAALGLKAWARSELIEIERRTRNKDYLKSLMSEYEKISAYDRSANIGFVDFVTQRSRQGLERGKSIWQSTYPKAYESFVTAASQQFGVPAEFVWSIMRAESRYNPTVISPVGAMGLLQLMPYTAERVAGILDVKTFRPHLLFEPETNVKLGTRYLKRLSDKLDGNYHLVAAAYNAGPHRVASWLKSFGELDNDEFIEHIPFVETRNYVKKVVHNYFVYSQIYQGAKVRSFAWLTQPPTASLEGPVPTREDWD